MNVILIDAQLSPSLAGWINKRFKGISAFSVRSQGLQTATDKEIFKKAEKMEAIIMTKDEDFLRLQKEYGFPPHILWITCGNSSNAVMRDVLETYLIDAVMKLNEGERVVEIGGF